MPVTQFVYQVFHSTIFFVVMELGDEVTAVVFRQELLIGKGKFMSSGAACEHVDCTCT